MHTIIIVAGWELISPNDMPIGLPAKAINDNFILVAAFLDISGEQLKIYNLADPANPQDAATKNYVDSEIATLGDGSAIIGLASLNCNKFNGGSVTTGGDEGCYLAYGLSSSVQQSYSVNQTLIAIGNSSQAVAVDSGDAIAIGNGSQAYCSGGGAIALGSSANATDGGGGAIAIGEVSVALETGSDGAIAIGKYATATTVNGTCAIAIGQANALASDGGNAVAIGHQAIADTHYYPSDAIAIGCGALAECGGDMGAMALGGIEADEGQIVMGLMGNVFMTATRTTFQAANANLSVDEMGTQSSAFIVPGYPSTSFLKADGSLDTNTYLTTSAAASTYLPLSVSNPSTTPITITPNGTGSGTLKWSCPVNAAGDRKIIIVIQGLTKGTATNLTFNYPNNFSAACSPAVSTTQGLTATFTATQTTFTITASSNQTGFIVLEGF